jgi:hypothetical protein
VKEPKALQILVDRDTPPTARGLVGLICFFRDDIEKQTPLLFSDILCTKLRNLLAPCSRQQERQDQLISFRVLTVPLCNKLRVLKNQRELCICEWLPLLRLPASDPLMDQQALHRLVVLLDEALTACPSEEMGKAMQVLVDRGRPNPFKQRIFVCSTILLGDIT